MTDPSSSRHRRWATVALLGTFALGLYLRWALTGRVPMYGVFADLRHAHSHLGYFGVLFPLAWSGWAIADAPTPGRKMLWTYGLATTVAFFGFVRTGYGPEAIAGCTVVGGIWLISAWPLRHRLRSMFDPLAVVPFGVIGALLCIPPIAWFLRRDPALAHAFVATFLSGLLLAVIVPSALAALRVTAGPWPLLALVAGLGAAALGFWPSGVAHAGLLVFAVLVARGVARPHVAPHLRLAWITVCVGLAAIAVGALPNSRPIAIGAIHFLVLGPVLSTLADGLLARPIAGRWWLLEYVAAGVLGGSLVLQGLGGGPWTLTASALGGTGVVVWWLAALFQHLEPRNHP